jgi:hypothetical protein
MNLVRECIQARTSGSVLTLTCLFSGVPTIPKPPGEFRSAEGDAAAHAANAQGVRGTRTTRAITIVARRLIPGLRGGAFVCRPRSGQCFEPRGPCRVTHTKLDASEPEGLEAETLRNWVQPRRTDRDAATHRRGLEDEDTEANAVDAQISDPVEVLRNRLSTNTVIPT